MNGHDQVRSHARQHSFQHPTPSESADPSTQCCCDSAHATAASPQTAITPGKPPRLITATLLSPLIPQTAPFATWHSPSTIRIQWPTEPADHCLLPPAARVQCPRMPEQVKPDGRWTQNRPDSRIPRQHHEIPMMPLCNNPSSSPLISQNDRILTASRRCRAQQRSDLSNQH